MTSPTITLVYPANVSGLWPLAEPLLIPALMMNETHLPEDVRKTILGGKAQLWVQWGDDCDAVVVTEFVDYPQGVWFRFWLAGAKEGAKVEWERFFDTLCEFAQKNNCKGIEDCGRGGWAKYCPLEVKNIGTVRRMNFGNGC